MKATAVVCCLETLLSFVRGITYSVKSTVEGCC